MEARRVSAAPFHFAFFVKEMFVLDHSGNALEFKSFRHPEHVFTA